MVNKSPQKINKPVWLSDPNRCGTGKNTGKKCVKARIPKCRGCSVTCSKWVSKPKLCGKTPINHLNKSRRKKPNRKSRGKSRRKSRGKSHKKNRSKSKRKSKRKKPGRKSRGKSRSKSRKLKSKRNKSAHFDKELGIWFNKSKLNAT